MNRYLSLGLFITLSIIVLWYITDYSEDNQFQPVKSKQYAEIFMNEFEMTAMNDSGNPSYILNGSHLMRYNDSVDTEIKQPVFHFLQETGQWKISADNAIINDQNETVQLNNNVIMQQLNIEPAVTIRTQNLLIHTATQIAQTQALVNITHGKSKMNSDGMIFNNITSELELPAKVNGYYLPYD